jgi:hypothetical protein
MKVRCWRDTVEKVLSADERNFSGPLMRSARGDVRGEILKRRFCTGEIAGLSWRKHQLHGIAQRIDERVDFGAQSTA